MSVFSRWPVVVIVIFLSFACDSSFAQGMAVGVLLDSLGPSADISMAVSNGSNYAVRTINHDGAGPLGEPIVVEKIEYEGKPFLAVQRLKAAIRDKGLIAVVGPCDAETAVRVAPLCEQAGIPLICPVALAPVAGGLPSSVYQLAPSFSDEAKLFLRDVRSSGMKKVGIYFQVGSAWSWVQDELSNLARASGVNVSFTRSLRGGRSRVDTNVDALLVFGGRDFCMQVSEAALSNNRPPALYLCSRAFSKGPTPRLSGALTAGPAGFDATNFRVKRFIRKYRFSFARVPSETAMLTYDAFNIISFLIERAASGQRLVRELKKGGSVEGIFGELKLGPTRREMTIALHEGKADSMVTVAGTSMKLNRVAPFSRARRTTRQQPEKAVPPSKRRSPASHGPVRTFTPQPTRSARRRRSPRTRAPARSRSAKASESSGAWWLKPRPEVDIGETPTPAPTRRRVTRRRTPTRTQEPPSGGSGDAWWLGGRGAPAPTKRATRSARRTGRSRTTRTTRSGDSWWLGGGGSQAAKSSAPAPTPPRVVSRRSRRRSQQTPQKEEKSTSWWVKDKNNVTPTRRVTPKPTRATNTGSQWWNQNQKSNKQDNSNQQPASADNGAWWLK